MPAVFPDAGHIAASLESNVARTPPTGFRVFPMTMAPPIYAHALERKANNLSLRPPWLPQHSLWALQSHNGMSLR